MSHPVANWQAMPSPSFSDTPLVRDPLSTPATWRAWLYEHIVLGAELGRPAVRSGNFNRKALVQATGCEVIQKRKLDDMSGLPTPRDGIEFLYFYADASGYQGLRQALRNAAAHGDYALHKTGWLALGHAHPRRGQKTSPLRLRGCMRWGTLKDLIHFIAPPQHEHGSNTALAS